MGVKILMLFGWLAWAPLARAQYPVIDGRWWASASAGDRMGFLTGFVDCSLGELKKSEFLGVRWRLLEPKVTAMYRSGGVDQETLVATVVNKIVSAGNVSRDGGEPSAAPHGFWDGEYWRQGIEERSGYVVGYIECLRRAGESLPKQSCAANWYVDRISKWYGVLASDPSEINEKRAPEPMAKVLRRFFRECNHITKGVDPGM